jgi:putative transposase
VLLTINGAPPHRWRAVEPAGEGLDLLVQRRRHTTAAQQVCRMRRNRVSAVLRVIITDQRPSDGAATREMRPGVEPRQHRDLHHRAEHSHQPTRQRERRI